MACLVSYLERTETEKKKCFIEFVLFLIHALITFLNYPSISHNRRELIGIIVMVLCTTVVALELSIVLKEQYVLTKRFIRWCLNKCSQQESSPTRIRSLKQSLESLPMVRRIKRGNQPKIISVSNSFSLSRNNTVASREATADYQAGSKIRRVKRPELSKMLSLNTEKYNFQI